MLISSAPSTVTLRFVPGVRTCGRAPRSVQLARTCGSRFRCVSSSASTTARGGRPISRATIWATTWSWSGSPRAVGLGRRQIATSQTRRYSVRALTCGQPRYRRIRGRVHGPGRLSSAAIRPVRRRPPSRGRPDRGRSASPASPSLLNRLIQRRTVAGWQSSSAAIWAGGKPCSDSSTITARAACRHRPCNSARSCSISLPGLLANTLTGRILTTTSPGGWTLEATSIQPPARLMSTAPTRQPHPRWARLVRRECLTCRVMAGLLPVPAVFYCFGQQARRRLMRSPVDGLQRRKAAGTRAAWVKHRAGSGYPAGCLPQCVACRYPRETAAACR